MFAVLGTLKADQPTVVDLSIPAARRTPLGLRMVCVSRRLSGRASANFKAVAVLVSMWDSTLTWESASAE